MDPFVGEIRAVGFNYAPKGWALCQGQLLSIAQNTALFSILGINYGGDGRTTFGLPDLRGRAVVQTGQGPGLSAYALGQVSGAETAPLLLANLPQHTHTVNRAARIPTNGASGSQSSPSNGYPAASANNQYGEEATGTMAANAITGTAAPVGGSTAHNNMMPYLAVNYIIALTGIYPPRP